MNNIVYFMFLLSAISMIACQNRGIVLPNNAENNGQAPELDENPNEEPDEINQNQGIFQLNNENPLNMPVNAPAIELAAPRIAENAEADAEQPQREAQDGAEIQNRVTEQSQDEGKSPSQRTDDSENSFEDMILAQRKILERQIRLNNCMSFMAYVICRLKNKTDVCLAQRFPNVFPCLPVEDHAIYDYKYPQSIYDPPENRNFAEYLANKRRRNDEEDEE